MKKLLSFAVPLLVFTGFEMKANSDESGSHSKLSVAHVSSLVSKRGSLSCWHGRSGQVQIVELMTEGENETLKLVDYSQDLKSLCPKSDESRTKKVEVNGEITSKFLLWGGNLKVKSFQVTQN